MHHRESHRGLEYLFATMMISWGVWLLMPMHSFDNPVYRPLAELAPEQVWGMWSVGIGAVRLTALYVNGRHRRTPIVRVACSILGIIWWGVLIFLYLAGPMEHPPAGFSWFFCFIFFEGIACRRSAADAYHARSFGRLKRKAGHGPG